jgi:hypothetical protein
VAGPRTRRPHPEVKNIIKRQFNLKVGTPGSIIRSFVSNVCFSTR